MIKIEDNIVSNIIVLDLSTSFDIINHKIVHTNLELYGTDL